MVLRSRTHITRANLLRGHDRGPPILYPYPIVDSVASRVNISQS